MAYRAQRQSLFGEVGSPRDNGPGVDYGRIIDAVTQGASSLIQNAFLRRVQQQEIERQGRRDAFEQERYKEERGLNRAKFEHEQAMDRAELLEKGYDDQPHKRNVPNIVGAMMPVPQEQPQSFEVTQTEPHYDLERNLAYRTATDRARITAEGAAERSTAANYERGRLQAQRLAAQQAGREYMVSAARSLTELRARLKTGASGTQRAMTGNALETARSRAAQGLLSRVGGSVDAALELLNEDSPEAKSFRDIGVELRHLSYAKSQLDVTGTSQAMRAQTSLGETPDSSAARVGATRKAVSEINPPKAAKKDTTAAPAAAAGGAKPKRTPDQAAAGAAELIRSGKATIEQALASKSLSDSAKKILRRQFGDSTKKTTPKK